VKKENERPSVLGRINQKWTTGEIDKYQYSEQLHANHMLFFDYAAWLQDTRIEEIQISKTGVYLIIADGLKFSLDAEDHYVAPVQLLNFGDYEPFEREILFHIVAPGMTVFDIGANTGWYALLIGKKIPECRIFAFEPLPATFGKLRQNIVLNGLANVKAFNYGLSDKDEEKTFYFSPEISGAASGADILGRKSVRTETCRVRRLDDVRRENAVCVDFIKCDVEGAELFVFQGGMDCFREDKPIVFCEMLRKWSAKFNYHPNQIINMFRQLGYQCYAVSGRRLERVFEMDEETLATNFMFLHEEKHALLKSHLKDKGLLAELGDKKRAQHL